MEKSKQFGRSVDPLLSIRVTATWLTLYLSTIYRMINAGQIQAERLPGMVGAYIKESEVERILKSRQYGVHHG